MFSYNVYPSQLGGEICSDISGVPESALLDFVYGANFIGQYLSGSLLRPFLLTYVFAYNCRISSVESNMQVVGRTQCRGLDKTPEHHLGFEVSTDGLTFFQSGFRFD